MNTKNFVNNQFFVNSNEIDRINEAFAYDNLYDYLKPVTVEEERAFASGGRHATPSECTL